MPLSRTAVRSFVLTIALVASQGLAAGAGAATYRPVASTSWGVNGNVHAVLVVGDTLVVGGTFTAAVSPTGQSVARRNLAAFSVSSGALLTDWHADADAGVTALAHVGDYVYVGGTFLNVGGVPRSRLAKLDVTDGSVDPAFAPAVKAGVKAIEAASGSLYIAGAFGAVGPLKRARVAKLDPTTGAPDPVFSASLSKTAYGLAVSPLDGTVWVCGLFDTADGSARLGLAGLDPATGALSGPAFTNTDVPMYGIATSPDGSTLFGAQKSNQGSAWRVDTGRRTWRVGTDGNVQAVEYFDGTVYLGFHDGYQGDTSLKLLAVDPASGAVDPTFRPAIDSFYGVFALDATANVLAVGGAFKNVTGAAHKHVALFTP